MSFRMEDAVSDIDAVHRPDHVVKSRKTTPTPKQLKETNEAKEPGLPANVPPEDSVGPVAGGKESMDKTNKIDKSNEVEGDKGEEGQKEDAESESKSKSESKP